jgi:hypothetical protein
MLPAAEMETEQPVLARIASLEDRLADIRAVVSLLLSAQRAPPPCAYVPLPLLLLAPRPCSFPPPPICNPYATGRCTFWL